MPNRTISLVQLNFLALLSAVALAGCAAPQSSPRVDPGRNSGIAIEVKLPRLGLNRQVPQVVYFIKLDGDTGIFQPTVIRSTYAKDGRVYLLNIASGRYAAVASFFYYRPVVLPGAPPGTSPLGGRVGFLTYFSEEMIAASTTEVVKGAIAFAGSYGVDQANCCKHADAAQRHFTRILEWRRTREWPDPVRIYSGDYLYTGSMREATRDDETRAAFFRSAKEDLASDWSSLIK